MSRASPSAQTQPMKFRLAGGAQPLMLVPVSVNGETPIEFILDTGAGATILTPQTAASGGVEITGSKQGHTAGGVVDVKLGRIRSLAVGSAHVEGVDVAITDLSHLGKAIGTQIHGDLGYNFLRHFRVTINFRRSEVRLDDPKRSEFFEPPPLVEVPNPPRASRQAADPDRGACEWPWTAAIRDRYRHIHDCNLAGAQA